MRQRLLIQRALEISILSILLIGCIAPKITTEPTITPTATPTPTMCTGWQCTVTGIVYAETADPGNTLEGATVTLKQTSNCSPTRGQHQITTGPDGRFEFSDIFLHDTDSIQIEVSLEGYESVEWKTGGFDCLYCSCFGSDLEIILQATP